MYLASGPLMRWLGASVLLFVQVLPLPHSLLSPLSPTSSSACSRCSLCSDPPTLVFNTPSLFFAMLVSALSVVALTTLLAAGPASGSFLLLPSPSLPPRLTPKP